jgi:hypothetical protein
MCNPVAIGLALTAAGTAAQAQGQRRAQKAMTGAREAERIRQKGYQSESDAILAKSMDNADKTNQDQQEAKALSERQVAAEKATSEVRAPVEATGENLAGDQTANAVINTEQANQAAKSLGYAGQQGGAKAKLLSFNDLNFNNAIANARAAQDHSRIAGFAKGSSDVLPVELEYASHKGDGLKTLGSALQIAGTIAGIGAGAGWWGSNPAAAAATAPGYNATSLGAGSSFGTGPYVPGWTTQPLSSLPVQQPLNLSLKAPSFVLR